MEIGPEVEVVEILPVPAELPAPVVLPELEPARGWAARELRLSALEAGRPISSLLP